MSDVFSAAQLEKVIALTLPLDALPNEKVIVGTLDQHGVQVVASFKRARRADGFAWELQAAAKHDWTGDNAVAGKVILRWL